MRQKNQRGFTLIELLVVTAIIGALAGIAIPQYNSYREKAEKASAISDGRAIYRAFAVYYIEWSDYPIEASGFTNSFEKDTFYPITDSDEMGGSPLDVDLEKVRDRLVGRQAEKYEAQDDTMGQNQEFYLVMPWVKDPTIKFVVAQSDNVSYLDNTLVDGGLWLDGVYITQDGNILGR